MRVSEVPLSADSGLSHLETPVLLGREESKDNRGTFVKYLDATTIETLAAHWGQIEEIFVSKSKQNVIRGFHLQLPPHEQWKAVIAIEGSIRDYTIDLRPYMPTFGDLWKCDLSPEANQTLIVPPGFGHAFECASGPAIVLYAVSKKHSPAHDSGVRWNSVGADWESAVPMVSDRDDALPTLSQYRALHS